MSNHNIVMTLIATRMKTNYKDTAQRYTKFYN
jgi:hypothetical protein